MSKLSDDGTILELVATDIERKYPFGFPCLCLKCGMQIPSMGVVAHRRWHERNDKK